MRGVPLSLILATSLATVACTESATIEVQGWFGLEMFADMNCANNPVWIEMTPDSDHLHLKWRKPVTYADGFLAVSETFRVTSVDGDDLRAIRLRDEVPALFRFASDRRSFTYFEGVAIESPIDPDLLVTFVRCESQGG